MGMFIQIYSLFKTELKGLFWSICSKNIIRWLNKEQGTITDKLYQMLCKRLRNINNKIKIDRLINCYSGK